MTAVLSRYCSGNKPLLYSSHFHPFGVEFFLKIPILILLVIGFLGAPNWGAADEPRYDVILKNGTVVDGSGRAPYQADVALLDGKIVRIGDLSHASTLRTVDVSGLIVAPGFIDLLCHNDLLWTLKEQERAIRRGVTSGLAGNCGFSILDVEKNLHKLQKYPGL